MEADPYQLIEGMTICAMAVGASQGYIYLRSEYPKALMILEQAINTAREANLLGDDIGASGRDFDIEVRVGAGAYICGEETSMLESLEGKRGLVRFKPPLPAIEGLFGKPTVVNNVLTLGAVSTVLAEGASHYEDYGCGRSRGAGAGWSKYPLVPVYARWSKTLAAAPPVAGRPVPSRSVDRWVRICRRRNGIPRWTTNQ
jgi:formate dehydrogenase iron-sulfur subunit